MKLPFARPQPQYADVRASSRFREDEGSVAMKRVIEQYIAANRVDATARDLTRLYATSTTVGAASEFRANNVSLIRYKVINKRDKSEAPPEHPLSQLFAPGHNFSDLMKRTELTTTFWGRNLIQKRRNLFKTVRALDWVNPNIYSLDLMFTGGQGLKGFRVYPSSMYQIEPIHYLDRQDGAYMHEVDFDDDYDGVSAVERAFLEASIEPEKAQTQLAIFRNMAIPAALLMPPEDGKNALTSPDDLPPFVQKWRQMFQGAANAGRTFISRFRWEYVQLQGILRDMVLKEIGEETRLSVLVAMNMPLELIVPSAANYAQFEGARRTWGHSWLVPRVDWYGGVFTEEIAIEFGDQWQVVPILDDVPFLKEDKATKVQVVNSQVQAGYMSLYDAALETEGKADEALRDLYLVQGVPVPKSELGNLWKSQFQQPPLPPGPTIPPLIDPATQTMGHPLPDAEKDTAPAGGKSLCIMLDLANHPDLLAYQARVKQMYIGQPVEWNPPADFHCTLLYAPSVTDAQMEAVKAALVAVKLPEMALGIGSLKSFDNLGNHALHFRVRRNTDLLDLQETVYDLCLEAGCAVSTYSSPANFIPHVTIGYCPQKPKAVIFGGGAAVTPTGLLLSVGDEIVWRSEQDAETASVKAQTGDAVHLELKNWRIVAGRKGRAYDFRTESTPVRIADFIRVALAEGDDLDAVFAEAQELMHGGGAVKSYADTRQLFADEVTRYLTEGVAEETNRRAFAARMRTALRVRGLMAFRDGMESVGYSPESFSADELASFREWQAEQSGYVSNLGAEVFGQGISEGEIAIRSRMWTDISLDDIYMRGVEFGNGEERFRWDYHPSAAHCTICPLLNGKVMTAKDWRRSGFRPGNGKTPCKQGCQCKQTRTDEQVNTTVEDLLALAVQA